MLLEDLVLELDAPAAWRTSDKLCWGLVVLLLQTQTSDALG